ncbi:MAG TPA: GTPase, partial [Beijerinckiaceae bacterium]|nr:GTPase [Beijerinckiaceae bacterium]
LLFATLDPTMREVRLPGHGKAILSDTVGFVSDLPTELIAAFRATLEEVTAADLILHVRDIAHPDSEAQATDVAAVLGSLGLEEGSGPPLIEVWNKADMLDEDDRLAIAGEAARRDDVILISALTGEGGDVLRERIAMALTASAEEREVALPHDSGERIAWLHAHGRVEDQSVAGDRMVLRVRMAPADWAKFEAL